MFGTAKVTSRSLALPSVARVAAVGALGALGVLLAVQLVQSLAWRMTHDAAVVQFLAYAHTEWGLVPYRDLMDTVLPMSLFIQAGAGRLLGYGDAAFRTLDVVWLLSLLGVSWAFLRPLGRAVAVAGPLLFGLVYLSFGPSMSFQRDFTGLLPIAVSVWLATLGTTTARGLAGRMLLIGVLFGVAAGIKPHLTMGLPVVFMLALANGDAAMAGWRPSSWRFAFGQALLVVLALVATTAIILSWALLQGAGPAFMTLLADYLPLYGEMTGQFKTLVATDRLIYLFTSFQSLGGQAILLAPAMLGGYLALFESKLRPSQRRLVLALLALMVLYAIYPVPAGKFWAYHWMPYFYFGSLGAALVLLPLADAAARPDVQMVAVVAWVLVAVMVVRPAPDFYRQLMGDAPRAPRDGQVDEMATFLRENLRDGETVQPLDFVTGGVLHAMMLADARPATPYIHISALNHHISSPTIVGLRQDLLVQLEDEPPRFVVDIPERARPTGSDTDEHIPELMTFLAAHYDVAQTGSGYVIYERTK